MWVAAIDGSAVDSTMGHAIIHSVRPHAALSDARPRSLRLGALMTTHEKPQDSASRLPYTAPTVRRLGTVTEMTHNRTPVGTKDGGANNTRTG